MRNPISLLPTPRLDLGLLVLRVGVGLAFVGHGGLKLLAGPDRWTALGGAVGMFGIDFAPTAWGFAAALTEGLGGLLVALGLLTRLATLPLIVTMLVAFTRHVVNGDSFGASAHPFEMMTVFLALLCIGPGRYSVDHALGWTRPPDAPPR